MTKQLKTPNKGRSDKRNRCVTKTANDGRRLPLRDDPAENKIKIQKRTVVVHKQELLAEAIEYFRLVVGSSRESF